MINRDLSISKRSARINKDLSRSIGIYRDQNGSVRINRDLSRSIGIYMDQ